MILIGFYGIFVKIWFTPKNARSRPKMLVHVFFTLFHGIFTLPQLHTIGLILLNLYQACGLRASKLCFIFSKVHPQIVDGSFLIWLRWPKTSSKVPDPHASSDRVPPATTTKELTKI